MKIKNIDGCDGLRMILKYADSRKGGLSKREAEELLLDQQRHENATINEEDEIDEDERCVSE